jgi:hypothetical protein
MSRTLGHKRLLPNNWIGEVRSTVGCRLRASARAPYMQLDNGTSTSLFDVREARAPLEHGPTDAPIFGSLAASICALRNGRRLL